MRKRGPEERGPIGAWLVQSRGGFRWTADEFLDALRASSGWAPVRTTYARWESGAARPDDANLTRVVEFYAALGVSGPGSPAPDSAPELATVLGELVAELREWRAERLAMRTELDALKALVGRMAEERLSAPVPAEPAAPSARAR